MVDSGDTGLHADTAAPCESVQGYGCAMLGEPPPLVCELESHETDSGEGGDAGQVQGGSCRCQASSGAPMLALVLALWPLLRRLGPTLVLLLVAGLAHAGTDAQSVQILDGGDFPVLRDADLGEAWSAGGTLAINRARNPAMFVDEAGAQPLLRNVKTREWAASVNLFGYLRLGLAYPSHRRVVFEGRSYDSVGGDLAFWIALPLAQRERWKLAWYAITELSTGDADKYLGDPSGILSGVLAGEVPAGPFQLLGNLGLRLQAANKLPGFTQRNRWTWGAGLRLEPVASLFTTAELQGSLPGTVVGGVSGEYPMEMVGQVGYEIGGLAAISVGGGAGLSHGVGSPAWRLLGCLDLRKREIKDSDGDGIPDVRDLCRRKPEDFDAFQDKDGCPEPDNDGDGFLDVEDGCPNDPETVNGWADDDGCPDQATRLAITVRSTHPREFERATLRLGSAEPVDLLPEEPYEVLLPAEVVTVDIRAEDHHDYHQRVPLEGQERIERHVTLERIVWGWLNLSAVDTEGRQLEAWAHPAEGQRVSLPTTGARVRAHVGEARWVVGAEGYRSVELAVDVPTEGEARHQVLLEPAVVWLQGEQLELAERLHFELDSAELSEASKLVLDDVASFLRDHPHIELLRVEGHADDTGSSRYNYDLSGRRAQAVAAYLSSRGVAQERLEPVGTGEARTVEGDDDGSRRVVFLVLVWADHHVEQPVVPLQD